VEPVFADFDLYLSAFWLTVQLFFWAALASLVLGTLLGALRVGPVAVMRRAASTYVTVVRNTPLLIVFIFIFVVAPSLQWFVDTPFLLKGVIALTIYTSAFVCESVRSGINAVPLGQAEAARAIGMTFGGSMRHVILPQSFRAVVPPLASVNIALLKNTSVAAAFGLMEATARMRSFTNANADVRPEIFLLFAIGYVVLVEILSAGAWTLERRWKVAAR
jgi:glutamate transport system permease protein